MYYFIFAYMKILGLIRSSRLLTVLTTMVMLVTSGTTSWSQCPDISSSSISPGQCATSCLLCPGDQFTINVEGFDLPDPGTVDFYYSSMPGFNPYAGQGTLLGSSMINTPPRMPCDECPVMEAIMVNACGNEAANEFIVMTSGSGFMVSDLSISLPNGGFCGFAPSPNTGLVSGCAVVGAGPGDMIPAGAIVVIFTSNNANNVYDFSGACVNGETVYVLQNSCTLPTPAFRNSCMGCGTRQTTFSLSCGCSGGITYEPEQLNDQNGDYVLAGGTPGNATCSTAPPVTVSPPAPIPSTVDPFTYIIPNNWCNTGPQEIVGILNPASVPPCLEQFTARFTIEVRCPSANPASAEACDNGNGTATFDLTSIESDVTGGQNISVNWFSDMNGTIPISSPYTTSTTTVYATVTDGCESDPVAVTLTVLPLPNAVSASDEMCEENNGEATFMLTNLENQINGGSGNSVTFYQDAGGTQEIIPPYTSGTTVIYATVFDGNCESDAVPINLTVIPAPPAEPAALEECEENNGQASFDLDQLVSTVNVGLPNQVEWYADPGLTIPINSPYLSGSTVIYAVVNDGQCDSEPVEITLTVKPKPVAFSTEETICDNGSGVATFDLEALDTRINGGLGSEVRYYENPNDPQELQSPYTTGTTTIFARVIQDGCPSDAVPIDLRVLPAPAIDTASLIACGDSAGVALFDLTIIEDSINLGSGFQVEWSEDSTFNQLISPPYIGSDTILFARVFNGGCYSPFVEIVLKAVPGPVLFQVPDTTICGFFILPEIEGSNLTGNEAYYFESNGAGDTLYAGDTIFMDATLYIFDQSQQVECISQESFTVTLRSNFTAGLDRTISVCEGSQVNLFNALDSADTGGLFTDVDGSGQLTDSVFNTSGLNGQQFRFQYNVAPSPPCPGDSALITVQVVSMVSAGDNTVDSFCLGTEVDLFTLLRNADLGGEFSAIDQGPVINNGRINTQGLSEGNYRLFYIVGDGMTCPLDSSVVTLELLAVPELEGIIDIQRCGEYILPPITGQNLGTITGYYTGPMGTGMQLMPGDTIRQNSTLYAYSENGLCTDEAIFEVTLADEVRTTINSTLCPGSTLQVGSYTFDESRPSGEVTFTGGSVQGCDSVVVVDLDFYPEAINRIEASLCEGEFIAVNGNIYDETNSTGTELLQGASVNGCDSIIEIDLTYLPTPVGQYQTSICEGDSILINGHWYSENRPEGTDTLLMGSIDGCDSLVEVSVSFLPAASNTIDQTLCPGEFIVINNVRYDQSNPTGEEVLDGASINGCDSVVSVSLDFFPEANSRIERTLCFGQQLNINGTVYDENNPSGVEVLTGQSVNGCDSTIQIALSFNDAAYNNISTTLCPGESIQVNQVIYDKNNPTGADTLVGASAAGCDSIIIVDLQFYPSIPGVYEDTLCTGDNLRLGGVNFNEQNPSGTVTLSGASANGCDSIVAVSISFEGGQLNLPNEYSIGPGGNVTLGAIFTGDIDQITWSPAEGLSCTDCLSPVANPSQNTVYTIEIVDRNGCIYTASTRVRINENFKVFLPNAFTPNDDGVNDRFMVMTNDQVSRVLYMRIFDRWGNLVYSEENVAPADQAGWDGTYRNKLMDPAVFVVVAEVEYTNGQTQIFETDLTLLR